MGDFADIRGQAMAAARWRWRQPAAHVLLTGPRVRKTMMARGLAGILPPLSPAEALEVTSSTRWRDCCPAVGADTRAAVRAPHHTISDVAWWGAAHTPAGRAEPRARRRALPGRDAEFERRALEVLRQPLEEGRVRIARASASVEFPASVTLVGAMNPCPCGYFGTVASVPVRAAAARAVFGAHLRATARPHRYPREVPWLPPDVLGDERAQESSAAIRERVVLARRRRPGARRTPGPR